MHGFRKGSHITRLYAETIAAEEKGCVCYAAGIAPCSLVVLDVQIALDTHPLARIHVLYLVDVGLPQRGVRVRVIVGARRSLVDNSKERLGGRRGGRGRRGEGGAHNVEYFFHAVPQSIFQLLDDLVRQ